MRSWPVPTGAMHRDPCTCDLLVMIHIKQHAQQTTLGKGSAHGRKRPTIIQTPKTFLCLACQAWDEGYVLVQGQRRYLRAMWILVHQAAVMEDADE